jgi:hypothetical protein
MGTSRPHSYAAAHARLRGSAALQFGTGSHPGYGWISKGLRLRSSRIAPTVTGMKYCWNPQFLDLGPEKILRGSWDSNLCGSLELLLRPWRI